MTNARNHSIRPRSTVRVLLLFVGLLRADGIFGGEPAARQLSQFVSQPSENVSLGDDVSPVVEGGVDYLRDIKPLLTENCYACHGALKTQSGLRLDTVALMKKGGDSVGRGHSDRSPGLWGARQFRIAVGRPLTTTSTESRA